MPSVSSARRPSFTRWATTVRALSSGVHSVVVRTISGFSRALVGIVDAREPPDLAAAGLGVHALRVPPLADLEGRVDVDQDETVVTDHGAALVAGRLVRAHGGADHRAVMTDDLRGDEADAADIGVAVLLAEPEALGQVRADDVAVQQGDGPPPLQQHDHQGFRDRGLAGPAEPGEPEAETLFRAGR